MMTVLSLALYAAISLTICVGVFLVAAYAQVHTLQRRLSKATDAAGDLAVEVLQLRADLAAARDALAAVATATNPLPHRTPTHGSDEELMAAWEDIVTRLGEA